MTNRKLSLAELALTTHDRLWLRGAFLELESKLLNSASNEGTDTTAHVVWVRRAQALHELADAL